MRSLRAFVATTCRRTCTAACEMHAADEGASCFELPDCAHGSGGAPRAGERNETADTDPAAGPIDAQPEPRQRRPRSDRRLAGHDHAGDDGDECEAVRVHHHVVGCEERARAQHTLGEEHLHGVARDCEEQHAHAQRRRGPAAAAAIATAMAVGESEADQAATQQDGSDLVIPRVALAQQDGAERHRGQQLARLDHHLRPDTIARAPLG